MNISIKFSRVFATFFAQGDKNLISCPFRPFFRATEGDIRSDLVDISIALRLPEPFVQEVLAQMEHAANSCRDHQAMCWTIPHGSRPQ